MYVLDDEDDFSIKQFANESHFRGTQRSEFDGGGYRNRKFGINSRETERLNITSQLASIQFSCFLFLCSSVSINQYSAIMFKFVSVFWSFIHKVNLDIRVRDGRTESEIPFRRTIKCIMD